VIKWSNKVYWQIRYSSRQSVVCTLSTVNRCQNNFFRSCWIFRWRSLWTIFGFTRMLHGFYQSKGLGKNELC